MKPAPGLKFRPWTAEDDDRLKSLIEASVSIDLIAAEMKRTTHGVKTSRARTGLINQADMGQAEGEKIERSRTKPWFPEISLGIGRQKMTSA